MKRIKKLFLLCGACSALGGMAIAEEVEENLILNTESVAERQARMAWWKEARFGMFVHWGLYSSAEGEWGDETFPIGAEWIQLKARVPAEEYEATMLPRFKPAHDFSAHWARLAKQAGAKYVVFTGKHHEGFSLHDSAQTRFDAKDVTGRDLHREIVSALREEGLRVGVYHSLWDWHHPDAPAEVGALQVRGAKADGRVLSRYLDYLHAQVDEVTDGRYGAVDVLWLDFSRNQYQGEAWGAKKLVELVRGNQPDILINNRLWGKDFRKDKAYEKYWFGDFTTPEQVIPATGTEGVDWETCDTLNSTWGWSKHAPNYKTSEQLIRRLVETVSKGGNYLLNVGPLPDGTIDPISLERFGQVGLWMEVNGEATYGTKAGPFSNLPWGRATSKRLADGTHRLYLHVFDWPATGELHVPGLEDLPARCMLLGGDINRRIFAEREAEKILLKGLPTQAIHETATVLALDFKDKPRVSPYRIYASADGSFSLEPEDAALRRGVRYDYQHLGHRSRLYRWIKDGAAASYPIRVEKAGTYSVEISAAAEGVDGKSFTLSVGGGALALPLQATGGVREWKVFPSGSIRLPAGESTLTLACKGGDGNDNIAISTLVLRPEN